MEREYIREQYPSLPERAYAFSSWKDTSANELTKSVIRFLNLNGWQAERINTMGTYRQGKKIQVGENIRQTPGQYVPTTGTKGSADISATIKGRSVKIEIKYRKDRLSPDQVRYGEQVERAGGIYMVARSMDQFIEWYDSWIEQS